MRRRCWYVPLRRLDDVPLRSSWVFHSRLVWDVLMGRHCYVLLRRCHDVPIRRRGNLPLRRLGDVPRRRCWVFHLRRSWDVAATYRETSLQLRHKVLLPGGVIVLKCWLLCMIVSAPLNSLKQVKNIAPQRI